jgi:hypothetical protein
LEDILHDLRLHEASHHTIVMLWARLPHLFSLAMFTCAVVVYSLETLPPALRVAALLSLLLHSITTVAVAIPVCSWCTTGGFRGLVRLVDHTVRPVPLLGLLGLQECHSDSSLALVGGLTALSLFVALRFIRYRSKHTGGLRFLAIQLFAGATLAIYVSVKVASFTLTHSLFFQKLLLSSSSSSP